jgi:hypothetical protein
MGPKEGLGKYKLPDKSKKRRILLSFYWNNRYGIPQAIGL